MKIMSTTVGKIVGDHVNSDITTSEKCRPSNLYNLDLHSGIEWYNKMNPVKIVKGYIGVLGRLVETLRQNGGPIGVFNTLYRTDDLKFGTLVGTDKYGNRYFQNNFYFYGRNRWVIYSDRVHVWYDGSQVPAEWFGWLHYKTDLLPHQDISRPKHKWMADHCQNLSGTNKAYVPYSTTSSKVEPWKPS